MTRTRRETREITTQQQTGSRRTSARAHDTEGQDPTMHNNDNTTTKPTGHRFARYRVTPSNVGCDLWLADGYHGDPVTDGPVTLHFWAPTDGGYAYEELPGRPGTLGRQVCETLFGLGSTLWCSRDALPDAIRRRARQHCDAIDREAAGARL